MIIFLVSCFFVLALVTVLCFSYELRIKVQDFFFQIIPQSKKRIQHAKNFAYELNYAAAPQQIQSHWHLQQWWILFAGFLLFASILLFAFTRPITASKVEADYLRKVDPQIYSMLDGQVLDAPPEVEEYLVQEAIAEEAAMIEQPSVMASSFNPEVQDIHKHSYSTDVPSADRKWHKMNPRYKQRLLMVFKIMREQHGYEMILLEGYRSPERQNNLATNKNTTRARGFQSYHQFGLAADVAFKRNGKVVITERDPWAMRGYQLYGQAAESVGLTWGGRWKSIQDYGHTEYRMPGLKKTAEMAALLTSEGQLQANNISIE
ncbi:MULTISPECIES: M15 family metallopeptidase [unclassified Acinetobacter]|uniref:M15 family metallopeptidase n=1 Tax=unclassified Acinetobacter TaxID=196816 RepID=UPI0015D1E35D|nr:MULTISPECIES: M15 family metallopeptidase [unclassified Acinetobacter]